MNYPHRGIVIAILMASPLAAPLIEAHLRNLQCGHHATKTAKPELDAFERSVQTQLLADGWMPGHYVADNEKTVRLGR